MSSLKGEPRKTVTLNTTMNPEVVASFKEKCKALGIPMNVILETFITQFIRGEYELCFKKSTGELTVNLLDNIKVRNID